MTRARVALAAAFAAALAVPAAATAHAELATSFPLDQDVVARSPARVALRFDESIETGLSHVHVLDARGHGVDSGPTHALRPDTVAVALAPRLPRGTYTVAWRVVADDGHAQRGAFVFHVVAPGSNPAGVLARVLAPRRRGATFVLADLLRFTTFSLILLAVGGLVASTFLVRERSAARLLQLVAGAGALLALSALARLVAETASSGGLSLREAASRDVLRIVLDSRFGRGSVAVAAAAVALAALATAGRRRRGVALAALVPAAVLVVAPAAMGHAEETGAGSLAVDALHVEAAAVWVGGLAFVLGALALARGERWEVAARVVPRFSATAFLQVPLLLVAGTGNAYFQLRGWWALFHTTYGQLVLAKVAIVLPLLALGAVNRRAVPVWRAGLAEARARRRFVRATAAETVLFAAVLGVTAVLVGEAPGRIAAARAAAARDEVAKPYEAALATRALRFELTVDPARVGRNRAILYVNNLHGQPAEGGPATLILTPAGGQASPVRVRAGSLLPGQFVFHVRTREPGTWLFTFLVRRPRSAAATETFQVPVR